MDIRLENIGHIYNSGTPMAVDALREVSLTIPQGSYTALIGHTGSGKSTLLQHLNVLLKPSSGRVVLGDQVITAKSKDTQLKKLRRHIGTVFQFPEAQLFEETIVKDVAFGPQNYGMDQEEAMDLAREMLHVVGVDEKNFDSSPFELSGGQQRRVAIAGVLALEPEVLILDEPTAGLDPKGQKELMSLFSHLHEERKITIILATHQMEYVAEYADQVAVLEAGTLVKVGHPREIFSDQAWLKEKQLDVPEVVEFANQLAGREGWSSKELPLTIRELSESIAHQLKQ